LNSYIHVKLGFRASCFTQSIRLSKPTTKKRTNIDAQSTTKIKANECSFFHKVCANIHVGSAEGGAPNDSAVLENGDVQTFPSKFPTLNSKAHAVPRRLLSDPKMRDLE